MPYGRPQKWVQNMFIKAQVMMPAGHGAVVGNHSYLCLAAGEHPCQRGYVVCWGCSQSLLSAGGDSQNHHHNAEHQNTSIVASDGHEIMLCA